MEYDVEDLETIEEIEHWLRSNDSEVNRNRPVDFSLPFSLRSQDRDFVFFARNEDERQIWVHELANLI